MKDPSQAEVTLRLEFPNDIYPGLGPIWIEASIVGDHLEIRTFEEGPNNFWPPGAADLDVLISTAELFLSHLREKQHDRAAELRGRSAAALANHVLKRRA